MNIFTGKTLMITGGTGMICSAVAEILFCLNHERNANIDILLAGRSRNRMMERFYCFSEGRDYSAHSSCRKAKAYYYLFEISLME